MSDKSTRPRAKARKASTKHSIELKTDWKALRAMRDEDIDTSDTPEWTVDKDFWKRARVVMPQAKTPVSLRMDNDVLAWFKRHGKGYQSHMLAVLRAYVQNQAH